MANIIELNPPLRKPIVYCAGRMGASPDDNDWRNCISAWRMLCEQSWSQYPDRDQIDQTFWLGSVTSSSVVSAVHNKYNPGLENRRLWATPIS